jgi:hypothetical protein
MTGSRTRVVWVRHRGKLVFFDTNEGRGEIERSFRGLTPDRPIITPSGRQVVFVDYGREESHVVNWDGTGLKKVTDGRITHVRMGPDRVEWIYVQTKTNGVWTAPLATPQKGELVWKFPTPPRKGKSTNFQTSADGKVAGATFPWPKCGVALLPQGLGKAFRMLGEGCWPQIARDNSYLCYHCEGGAHQWLVMHDVAADRHWRVRINPRRGSSECPRWSNDVRFVVTTDRPAKTTWVYVGEFDAEFRRFERWVPVSRRGSNSGPDCWVEGAVEKALVPATKVIRQLSGTSSPSAVAAAWPGDHKGLVFLWEAWGKENKIVGADGKVVRQCSAVARGRAVPWHHGAADLTGGALVAEGVADALLAECRKSNEFSIEAVITPVTLRCSQRGSIVSFSAGPKSRNFTLSQEEDHVVLRVERGAAAGGETGAGKPFSVCSLLATGRPIHLLVSFRPGYAAGYVNGRRLMARRRHRGNPAGGPAAARSAVTSGPLSGWGKAELLFGQDAGGGSDWPGRIEGIAIYSRYIGPAEARRKYELYAPRLKKRKTVPQVTLVAALASVTATPRPESIGVYPRCLVLYEYEVRRVLRGRCEHKRIGVYHWGILDSRKVDLGKDKGGEYRLTVEAFSDNPQLDAERRVSDLEALDLPLYVDVGRARKRGQEPFGPGRKHP